MPLPPERNRRPFRWIALGAVALFAVLGAVAVPVLLSDAAATYSDPAAPLVADLAALTGVASIGETHARSGDLTFRDNVFVPMVAANGLTDSEANALVDEISSILARAQGSTRFMAELDLGAMSIGISPVSDLNPARLALARALASVDTVVRATVLWPRQGDDLIVDDSNSRLDVWVQANEGSVVDLADVCLPFLDALDAPELTAVVLGTDALRERVYEWESVEPAEEGHRILTLPSNPGGDLLTHDAAQLRALSLQLDVTKSVTGYSIHPLGGTVAFAESMDLAKSVAALELPDRWESVYAVSRSPGGGWERELVDVNG